MRAATEDSDSVPRDDPDAVSLRLRSCVNDVSGTTNSAERWLSRPRGSPTRRRRRSSGSSASGFLRLLLRLADAALAQSKRPEKDTECPLPCCADVAFLLQLVSVGGRREARRPEGSSDDLRDLRPPLAGAERTRQRGEKRPAADRQRSRLRNA